MGRLYCPIPSPHVETLGQYVTVNCLHTPEGREILQMEEGTFPLLNEPKEVTDSTYRKCACLWGGSVWELRLIEQICSFVVIHRTLPRQSRLAGVTTHLPIIFLGMQNLDELRVARPYALLTRVPFSAALKGIELRERERRPKNVESYDLEEEYPRKVIARAERNFISIHLALEGRRDA